MKERIKQAIFLAIKAVYPEHADLKFTVEYPPENVDGDFASNVAMVLGKKLGLAPLELAILLQEKLNAASADFEVSVALPGFLNFQLSEPVLLNNLGEILRDPKRYGASDLGQGQLAITEYFQLNVAKPPHVGHLRSAVIGDALKRILRFVGYKTVSDTHIGDWGTQFGELLLAYKTLDGKHRVKHQPLEELNTLYQEINKQIETKPALRDQAKEEFVRLEQGNRENRKLWKFFVKVSRKEFEKMVKMLKLLPFDYDLGESFYESRMKEIVRRLEKANLLTTGETGERYVDLEKYGLGRLICLKSDGGTTYELRDLATLAYRYDELAKKEHARLAWNLYFVDSRQSHDFRQVFQTMKFLGYDTEKSRHVAYGFMSLPEGPISTRKGTVVSLEALIAEAVRRAQKIIEEKNPTLKNQAKVAGQVGLGAVKYADLAHNRKSDIVFQWDEVLSFEGNTGPYLQYTYARLRSILRKNRGAATQGSLKNAVFKPAEARIMRQLSKFPDIVADTARNFLPSDLASYLYELASVANTFYHSSPVLQEPDEKLRALRLGLVQAAAAVLKQGLDLLGIEAPEEM